MERTCHGCGSTFESPRQLAKHFAQDPSTNIQARATFTQLSATTVRDGKEVWELSEKSRRKIVTYLMGDADELMSNFIVGLMLSWKGSDEDLEAACEVFEDVDDPESALALTPLVKALLSVSPLYDDFDAMGFFAAREEVYVDGACWN